MKNYIAIPNTSAQILQDTTHVPFFFLDTDARGKNELTIRINGNDVPLYEYIIDNIPALVSADVYSIRFLSDGIGIARGGKFFSTYEGNLWNGLTRNSSGDEIDNAFQRFGTLIKAGKFAKSLGLSDVDAEAFSKSYDNAFKQLETDRYEFKIVKGNDVSKYYNYNTYATRNSSPLWQSCMNCESKERFVKWYDKNQKFVSLAVLFRDGKVVARAICWNKTTFRSVGEGSQDSPYGDIVFSGMFVDRNYYYDDESLTVFRDHLNKLNCVYKETASAGSGNVRFPDGKVESTYDYFIEARIQYHGGSYPYMDTLCYVSSDKVVCNAYTSGKIRKAQSTTGGSDNIGEYVKVDLTVNRAKFFVCSSRHTVKVLLPSGKISTVMVNDLRTLFGNIELVSMNAFSNLKVIKEMATLQTVTLNDGYSFETYVYANQLTLERGESGKLDFKVSEIYVPLWERFLPINVVTIKRGKLHRIPVPRKKSELV